MPDTPPATTPPTPPATPPAPPPAAPAPPQAPPAEQPLGEAGIRALQAERDARAAAERALAEEKAARLLLEREKMTEVERLKAEAAEGTTRLEAGTAKLREAYLLTALAGKGLVGTAARAAVKLLEGVEYDAADSPVNLDDRITVAMTTYGDAWPKAEGATPPPATPPQGPKDPQHPNLHQGPRATPTAKEEDEAFEAYFASNFPGRGEPAPTT